MQLSPEIITQLESLLPWGTAREVPTKYGPRILRKCKLNGDEHSERFWNAWRAGKEQLKAAGVGVGKNEYEGGEWEATWWREIPTEIATERKAAVEASRATDAEVDVPCPEGLAYMPFQRGGMAYSLKRTATLIGDEMGLGKTIQALGVCNAHKEWSNILIVTKAGLKINWWRECRKWLVNRSLTVGIADKEFPTADVVIINFDIVRKYQNRVNERNWDCVIVDECHHAKSATAQRTKAIFGYKPKRDEDPKLASSGIPARYKMALTGTPIENCIEEMFPVLHWLDREKFRSKSALQKLAGQRYIPGAGMTEASQDGLANLQQYLRENIMIRRLKKDVLKELPPKTRTMVEFSAEGLEHLIRQEEEVLAKTETERTAAQAALVVARAGDNQDEYRAAIERLKEVSGFEFAEMARIRKETAVAKVPQMIEHLKAQLEETRKVLVFAHHTEALEVLHAAFRSESVLVHGAHGQGLRDERVHRFMADPTCRLFFGSIRATGEGLTLTAATLVVFHEFDWVPSKMVQCEDRCIAEGQKVLTTSGWVPIETIKVGDEVINRHGIAAVVTDCWNRGAVETMAEIQCEGMMEPIVCTEDHRILIESEPSAVWVEASKLRPGMVIAMPSNAQAQEVSAANQVAFDSDCVINTENSRAKKAPCVVELDPLTLFVMGYYAGDGFACTDEGKGKFISFSGNTGKKTQPLEKCLAWMMKQNLNVNRQNPSGGKAVEIRGYSTEWAMWFRKHFGHGAHNKRLPWFLSELNVSDSQHLLDGLMASDGYHRRGRYEFVTMSETLAAQVALLTMRCGHKPCVTRQSEASGRAFIVAYTVGVKKGLNIESITFRNPKKSQGKREKVYDLTVQGDPSFVVGTAVVHNCHRIGQHDNVTVQVCVVPGTIDAQMGKTCVQKAELADRALDAITKVRVMDEPPIVAKEWKPLATRKQLEDHALLVTDEQRQAVRLALQSLAGVCDGARKVDGAGFNKLDSAIGKDLAMRGRLSDKQVVLGARLVRRYSKQLPLALVESATRNIAAKQPGQRTQPERGQCTPALIGRLGHKTHGSKVPARNARAPFLPVAPHPASESNPER